MKVWLNLPNVKFAVLAVYYKSEYAQFSFQWKTDMSEDIAEPW